MPTHSGPNTFGEENLVFGYDLADTVNSYVGEPTTNLWGIESGTNVNNRSSWSMPYAYNGAITDSVYLAGTWNGNRIWEVLHTAGTSGYGGYESWRLCVNQPTAGSGTYSTTRRVAIKICILEGSITDMGLHTGGGNGGHNAGAWTPIPEYQIPKDCPQKSGWYQFLADGSWGSDSIGHCVGLGFISLNRVKILTTEPMYYPSSKLLPFTGYQRSNSQGLLDLASNSTITLSNVSFDSNAQMTFDGTDDYLSIGPSSQLNITTSVSIFAMIKINNASGWDGIFGTFSGGGFIHFQLYLSGINCYVYGPNAGYDRIDAAQCYVTPGQWTEVGMTFGSNTLTLYINGVALPTRVTGNGDSISGTDTVSIGRVYDSDRVLGGEIAKVSVYNFALTQAEVAQNFNAHKNRFGL